MITSKSREEKQYDSCNIQGNNKHSNVSNLAWVFEIKQQICMNKQFQSYKEITHNKKPGCGKLEISLRC